MHCGTLKQDNDSTVRGDGGSRVGEVRAGTTSPMPEHKGFKLQQLSRDPLTPADGPGSVSVKGLYTNYSITFSPQVVTLETFTQTVSSRFMVYVLRSEHVPLLKYWCMDRE